LIHQVFEIDGLAIPRLVASMASELVIEMTSVQPPYMLDFGKAYIDLPPPYFDDSNVLADQYQKIREEFGSNALRVHSILRKLELYGVYYADPHPRNIHF
jgi:hypothetical protein